MSKYDFINNRSMDSMQQSQNLSVSFIKSPKNNVNYSLLPESKQSINKRRIARSECNDTEINDWNITKNE